MNTLALNHEESELLIAEGWQMSQTSDGPEFYKDFGRRQVHMGPVIHRNSQPMRFRSQAQRFDTEYSKIAKSVGWASRKSFGAGQKSTTMSTFKILRFNAEFAHELSALLSDWALNADPKQVVFERIERRKKVRMSLSKADFIDYSYLRSTEDLMNISSEEMRDGTEYLSPLESIDCLRRAIEVSKRP